MSNIKSIAAWDFYTSSQPIPPDFRHYVMFCRHEFRRLTEKNMLTHEEYQNYLEFKMGAALDENNV